MELKVILLFCCLSILLFGASSIIVCKSQPVDESGAITKAPLDGQVQQHSPAASIGSVRSQFSLLALSTFSEFKLAFSKHYGSFLEEIVRRKIFLGRTFRAFISQVKYRHFSATSYLGINEMSDETPAERERVRLTARQLGLVTLAHQHQPLPEQSSAQVPVHGGEYFSSLDSAIPVADLSDIKHEIDEIEARKDELGYKEIAQELEQTMTPNLKLDPSSDSIIMSRQQQEAAQTNADADERSQVTTGGSSAGSSSLVEMKILTHLNGTNYLDKVVKSAVRVAATQAAGKGKGRGKAEAKAKGKGKNSSVKSETSTDDSQVYVDHRNSGCLNPVRNQYLCGSCYTFSSIALYEYLYCKAYGKRISFSEQYMLDCGFRKEMFACDGGFPSNAVEFIDSFGLELRKDYPYKKQAGSCPYEEDTHPGEMGFIKPHKTGWKLIEELEDIDRYLSERPILFTLSLTPTFRDYAGGIDDGTDCDDDHAHAMLLVGHGHENGQEYYLFRNSHGPQWGEKGYYRFNKEALDRCAPNDYGVFSIAEFLPSQSDGLNPHYTLDKSSLDVVEVEEKKQPSEQNLVNSTPERPRTRSRVRLE